MKSWDHEIKKSLGKPGKLEDLREDYVETSRRRRRKKTKHGDRYAGARFDRKVRKEALNIFFNKEKG